MITSQFIATGIVKQVDIVKAFGVPIQTVKRYVKLYREKGVKGFYAKPRKRGAGVLLPEVLIKAQEILDEGKSLGEVSKIVGIKTNTLNKAVQSGKLHRVIKKK